jgi:hypothetical protein
MRRRKVQSDIGALDNTGLFVPAKTAISYLVTHEIWVDAGSVIAIIFGLQKI